MAPIQVDINFNNEKPATQNEDETPKSILAAEYEIKTLQQENITPVQKYSPLHRQMFAILGPLLSVMSSGMVTGYSAIALPQLMHPNSTIHITQDEASWIASISALPMAPGCFIGGYLMEQFGRRTTHMIICVPLIFGWISITIAQSLPWILIGRTITGLAVGLLGPPVSVYIGETTDPKYRGVLLGGISLFLSIGILICHVFGTFFNWKVTSVLATPLPLICFILMRFVPESPSWLLGRDEIEKAEKSFKWLRGHSPSANEEFRKMVERHESVQKQKLNEVKLNYFQDLRLNLSKIEFVQPMIIMLVFFAGLQYSGVNAVSFYTVNILQDTLKDGINEYLAMIIIDLIRLTMSVLSMLMMKRYGRRTLSMLGLSGTTVSLLALALFLYLIAEVWTNSEFTFLLPLVCLIAYICFTTIGVVPLPWILIGEIFPIAQRGLASGIATAWNFVSFFIVVKTSPALFAGIKPAGTFMLYGVFALLCTVFLYFKLPETKNKTLQEIEDEFTRGKKEKSIIVK